MKIVEKSIGYQGHEKGISSLKYSPDGTLLLSSSADATLKVWTETSPACVRTYVGHKHGINDIAWSSTGQYVVSASNDFTLRLWDVETGKTLSVLGGHEDGHLNYVFCTDMNPQGTLIVSGSFDESVILWDVRTGKSLKKIAAHSEAVTATTFCRDGTMILTSSYDGLSRMWDTATGQCLKSLIGDTNIPASSSIFTPNSSYALVGSLDNTVRMWDYTLSTPVVIKEYTGHVNKKYCILPTMAVLDSVPYLVCGSEDHKVYLYDIQSTQVAHVLEGHTDVVLSTAAHPKKNRLATATAGLGNDKGIRIWETSPETTTMEVEYDTTSKPTNSEQTMEP